MELARAPSGYLLLLFLTLTVEHFVVLRWLLVDGQGVLAWLVILLLELWILFKRLSSLSKSLKNSLLEYAPLI